MNISEIGYRLVQENQSNISAPKSHVGTSNSSRARNISTAGSPCHDAAAKSRRVPRHGKCRGRQHFEDRPLALRHGDRPQADAGQVVLLRCRRRHRRADRQGQRRVLRLSSAAHRRQQLPGRHQAALRSKQTPTARPCCRFRAATKTRHNNEYQWIATATTPDGRLAYLGFHNVWRADISRRPVQRRQRHLRSPTAPSTAPDRPSNSNSGFARPSTTWTTNRSSLTNRSPWRFITPREKRSITKRSRPTTTAASPANSSCPPTPRLGQYQLVVVNRGGGSFRVEEYKKPEFEVTIEAPTDPVMLGEKITATIRAKYYFGSPVTSATVKYKSACASEHTARWYPPGPWDWLYGPGYWWFAYDYDWYPGWRNWGCRRPAPWWYWRPAAPPEIVAEREVPIGCRWHRLGRDRHIARQGCAPRPGPPLLDSSRSRRPIAAHDRRQRRSAGGPQAVSSLSPGSTAAITASATRSRRASPPAGSTASRSKAPASCAC